MERMSEEEFINNVEGRITSLKNLYNKALKILVSKLEEENKTLKDNVEFLHSCLDDRDKSIAIMQEENDKLKIHIEAKDKAYMDLLADYNYLKARIKKTERAFIKYKEKLEKLEVDLDMVVMNR